MARTSTSNDQLVKSAVDALINSRTVLHQNINALNELLIKVTLAFLPAVAVVIYYAEFREPQFQPFFYLFVVYLIGIFGLFVSYCRRIVYAWLANADSFDQKIALLTHQPSLLVPVHQSAYDLSVVLFNFSAVTATLVLFFWSFYRVTDLAVNYWQQAVITYTIFGISVANVLSLLHNIFKWRQLTK